MQPWSNKGAVGEIALGIGCKQRTQLQLHPENQAVAEAALSHSNSNLPQPLHSAPLKSAQDTKEKKTLATAGR
ncbi:hypothetical protein Ddye_019265 [Dipteronia dyeriana]|uniref:Uncharacterized protein n=1 Tax=Dipteronia dyeriana TaxID=168575 RepID=A0AAD9WVV1_9ROSI|nr:hypothetical protein Ddye_019265 [Dipteronia dyeriana]